MASPDRSFTGLFDGAPAGSARALADHPYHPSILRHQVMVGERLLHVFGWNRGAGYFMAVDGGPPGQVDRERLR